LPKQIQFSLQDRVLDVHDTLTAMQVNLLPDGRLAEGIGE